MEDFSFDFEKTEPLKQPSRRKFGALHRREVCRYWLINQCKKGEGCEFLHQHDPDKMPPCRKGESNCGDPSCFLKHDSKKDKPLCPNYDAGFCSFGYSCQFRHETKDVAPQLPSIFLKSDPVLVWNEERRKKQRKFRSEPCPYFLSDGWCPYFHACGFKH